jgi:hypothetical protein
VKYRKFGGLDWNVSALGFGAMRLPALDNDFSQIDEPKTVQMIRYAIDHGVNYIDTAYGYHRGNSEIVIGKALLDGYRQKVKIATKLPCHDVIATENFDRCLNEQLKRLKTDTIDFYLLHHLNQLVWPKMRKLKILEWADKAIADGRIGYFGFSFHDNFELFKEIIDSYNWTLCQIQYNFADENFQAGTQGLLYAHNKGLAVVVMEPIKGGRLLRPPENIAKLWEQSTIKRTPQEWALRWVWNHPEVAVTLSGMNSLEQVMENIKYANYSQPNNLSLKEREIIERVRDAYRSLNPVPCTACRYCVPCPNGVDIPRVFEFYNEAVTYNDVSRRRFMYGDKNMIKNEQRADMCTKCGQCLDKCPQKIDIPEMLEKAHAFLINNN